MPQFITDGPLWLIIGFLLVVVFSRAQGTYWLGRAVVAGTLHADSRSIVLAKIAAWFTGPIPQRGKAALEKWGLIIIPLSFLTFGFQTAVNAAAGLVRLSWRRYTLAMLPGCVAWALLYGLGLLAIWLAVISALSPLWWALLAVIVAGALSFRWYRGSRRTVPEPARSQ